MKRLLKIFLLTLLCVLSKTVRADSVLRTAHYDVTVGTARALQAELGFTRTAGEYAVALTMRSSGLVRLVGDWHSVNAARGLMTAGNWQPLDIDSENSFRGDRTRTVYRRSKITAPFLFNRFETGQPAITAQPVDPSYTQGAIDLTTGLMRLFDSVKAGKGCNARIPMFDSKRRYLLISKDMGVQKLPRGRAPAGDIQSARQCVVHLEPVINGFKKRQMWLTGFRGEGKDSIMPITLWLAEIAEAHTVLPVRIDIDSPYGKGVALFRGMGDGKE